MASNMNQPLVGAEGAHHHHVHGDSCGADPKWDSVDSAWDALHAESEDKRVFFDHIVIAQDGGLSEIGVKDELWYNSRYITGVILIVFVFYNIYFILMLDIGILVDRYGANAGDDTSVDDDYLLSKSILEALFGESAQKVHPKSIIAIIEMLLLLWFILVLLKDVFDAVFRTGHAKWKGISEVCWIDLPDLSIFSAIKLLGFIVPQKLSYDINYAIWYATGSKVVNLGWIALTRPLALIIGMDCFLVKYRGAAAFIMKKDGEFNDIMGGIIFLNQVLGVVNITYTIKSRLYRFVFGGEDGIMSERELVRQDVWESFVAELMFERYPKHKALAMMLSWCDDDFQMLALNEKHADA
jgi:hypothetical protein